jgi:predicted O-methyltransferase YrrM
MKIEYIKKEDFYRKYKVKNIDLVKLGLFGISDLRDLNKMQNSFYLMGAIKKLYSYSVFSLKHPQFFKNFILKRFSSLLLGITQESKNDLKSSQTIKDCILLASIAASFKPKGVLEIGTYLGWGSASLKKACPSSDVYTINPKDDKYSNNPIDEQMVGSFFRKKKMKVNQIWSDSTRYDFSKLPVIDVSFIDGNHEYSYVLKDLYNVSKITKKCVIMDDYIPEDKAIRSDFIYGPWNEGVVRATNDFLRDNQNIFKKAYWIEGTDFCVLIK